MNWKTRFFTGRCPRLAMAVLASAVLGCGSSREEAPDTRITINSAPEEGAQVLIGGIERGLTPVVIEGIEPGWVDVLLKREKYKRAMDRIEVREGVEDVFVIEMEPLKGFLTLESKPGAASVYIDGEAAGKTPLIRKAMMVGEHSYEMRLENYYPVTETLTVKEDYQYEFVHQLKPIEATLSLFSRPTGANVWLNNQKQMRNTPAKFKLPPGTYLISVYSKGFVQKDVKAVLGPNESRSVTLEMVQGQVPPGMTLVPAGKFVWGEASRSPDESPRREVVLDAFYIDKYEVTNVQFKAVFPGRAFPEGQDQFPVSGVSWNQAVSYSRAVGKRLPTEAEWEKAARGEDGREYPWGEEFDPGLCNTAEKDIDGPVSAGRFLGGVSPYGCMDMSGNVYEWTRDWYEAYPGNKSITKDYGQVYRVLRGGSFSTSKFHARCARRHFDRMDATRADYGFRCAMDVTAF